MMLLQPLVDLQTEINRLMIAGSRFAYNDPRLAKLLPIFQKMGEKAPVFQKIAQNIEALLQVPAEKSAEALTTLSTLLYAVLYTQGKSVIHGDSTAPQPTMDIEQLSTELTYLELEPTITALTTTGSGRHDIVMEATEQKKINDLRLYPHIVKGLEDKYSELAYDILNTVIPKVGQVITPFILADLVLDNKKGNAMRISALSKVDYPFDDAMISTILSSKSQNLITALLPALSKDPKHLPILIEASQAKKMDVRETAWDTLAEMNHPEAWAALLSQYRDFRDMDHANVLGTLLCDLQKQPEYHESLLSPLVDSIHDLMSVDWQANLKKTNLLIQRVYGHLQLFLYEHHTALTDVLTNMLLPLGKMLANQPFDDQTNQSRHYLLQSIMIYLGRLQLDESDPIFKDTIAMLNVHDDYIAYFLSNFNGHHQTTPAFIYHACVKILGDQPLDDFADELFFLIRSGRRSQFSRDELYHHFYFIMAHRTFYCDKNNYDPRWADLLHQHCATEAFSHILSTPYSGSRKAENAFSILSIYHTVEPIESERIITLLRTFIDNATFDTLGAHLQYLETRLGRAAHPIILAKIDAEIARIHDPHAEGTQYMKLVKERIQSRR